MILNSEKSKQLVGKIDPISSQDSKTTMFQKT